MTKKKNCKHCGEYSGKKNVCKKCKELAPYHHSTKGTRNTEPFNRQAELDKINKKGKNKLW